MRYYFLIIALIAFSCNSNYRDTKQKESVTKRDNCFTYPSEVDSLHVKDLYDSARWYVYAWYCDMPYKPKYESLIGKSFGELELKFYNLAVKHDTLELNFNFIDKGQAILPSMMKEYKELVTGVGFNMRGKEKIYMLSPNGFSKTIKGGANRYENPLQPEVIKYLNDNWDKLNDCFRKLAEQKAIKK